jgi:oligopeptide/dipeptide ABC transporter ATP-binding protein
MIFQDPRACIDPLYRCGDHLHDALHLLAGLTKQQAKNRALELLADVGIAEPERVYRAYPGELSGGMLQRVMIAGALATSGELLIADEPTTALDVTIQAEIMAILDQLRRESCLSALFITHDLELAAMICDRILVMYAGHVLETRVTEDLFHSPLHPYTLGLLSARPSIERRKSRLQVIPGHPPDLHETLLGCPFEPRCGFSTEECVSRPPTLVEVETGASSACWRTAEITEALAAAMVRP